MASSSSEPSVPVSLLGGSCREIDSIVQKSRPFSKVDTPSGSLLLDHCAASVASRSCIDLCLLCCLDILPKGVGFSSVCSWNLATSIQFSDLLQQLLLDRIAQNVKGQSSSVTRSNARNATIQSLLCSPSLKSGKCESWHQHEKYSRPFLEPVAATNGNQFLTGDTERLSLPELRLQSEQNLRKG